jgi:hypothetical protein
MNGDKKQDKIHKKNNDERRIPLHNLLIEVVSIILGVTLALAVNEWRESRSHDEQAAAALINIREEISANLKIMEFLHINNTATLNIMRQEQMPDSSGDYKFIPGIQLRETSWQTMLNTGISAYVAYETILMLSETYAMQEVYKKTATMMTEAAMNMAAYAAAQGLVPDNRHFQRQFIDYFEMMVEIENILIQSYQDNLKQLKISE